MFPSPACRLLTSFGFLFLNVRYILQVDSSTRIRNLPKVLNSNPAGRISRFVDEDIWSVVLKKCSFANFAHLMCWHPCPNPAGHQRVKYFINPQPALSLLLPRVNLFQSNRFGNLGPKCAMWTYMWNFSTRADSALYNPDNLLSVICVHALTFCQGQVNSWWMRLEQEVMPACSRILQVGFIWGPVAKWDSWECATDTDPSLVVWKGVETPFESQTVILVGKVLESHIAVGKNPPALPILPTATFGPWHYSSHPCKSLKDQPVLRAGITLNA